MAGFVALPQPIGLSNRPGRSDSSQLAAAAQGDNNGIPIIWPIISFTLARLTEIALSTYDVSLLPRTHRSPP
jgi:hypothetical protein